MIIFSALFAYSVLAQEVLTEGPSTEQRSRLPVYVSLNSNINDFGRFADGGPDENWYIGFNNAWIVALPPAPIGEYSRAFIGAKIGRAKTRAKPGGRPWEREVIPGKIYMAIAPTPSFSAERSYFLTETADIPLEDDPHVYMPGTGHAEWFWTEVPAGMISFSGPNYLIVWSTTRYFVGSSSAPILAALEERSNASEEPRAWNNRSLGGVAPRRAEGTLETPLNNFKPALAIKLVPPNDATVAVRECAAAPAGADFVYRFTADGDGIEAAWLESSTDQLDWERLSAYRREPPFLMTVPRSKLSSRGAWVRAVARDQLHNEGHCDGVWMAP